MKKKCALLIAMTMLLTSFACACKEEEETTKKKKTTKKTTVESIEDPTEEPTEEPTEDTTETTDESIQETIRGSELEGYNPDIYFTIYDREGHTIEESIFAEHKLTMINFWEPWCGPCVSEMPELERLYEDYQDQGLLIIGVYSTDNMEEEVEQVLQNAGTTYPICFYDPAFDPYQSGYVPTTIFVDENGHVYTVEYNETYVIGGKDYDTWVTYVERFLA